jgi:hypothetical protein
MTSLTKNARRLPSDKGRSAIVGERKSASRTSLARCVPLRINAKSWLPKRVPSRWMPFATAVQTRAEREQCLVTLCGRDRFRFKSTAATKSIDSDILSTVYRARQGIPTRLISERCVHVRALALQLWEESSAISPHWSAGNSSPRLPSFSARFSRLIM